MVGLYQLWTQAPLIHPRHAVCTLEHWRLHRASPSQGCRRKKAYHVSGNLLRGPTLSLPSESTLVIQVAPDTFCVIAGLRAALRLMLCVCLCDCLVANVSLCVSESVCLLPLVEW